MDALVFAEFCERLTEQLRQDDARLNGNSSEIIPMEKFGGGPGGGRGGGAADDFNANLNDSTGDDIKAPIPDSPDPSEKAEDDLLQGLGEGNYLQPRKESDI